LEGEGTVRQLRIRLREFVLGAFQSAEVIFESPCPDAGFGLVSVISLVLDTLRTRLALLY